MMIINLFWMQSRSVPAPNNDDNYFALDAFKLYIFVEMIFYFPVGIFIDVELVRKKLLYTLQTFHLIRCYCYICQSCFRFTFIYIYVRRTIFVYHNNDWLLDWKYSCQLTFTRKCGSCSMDDVVIVLGFKINTVPLLQHGRRCNCHRF